GKYDLASENAEKALELNSYLEDYKLYTTKLKTTWGRVCLIEDENVPFPDAKDNKETVWGRLGTSSMGALNAEVYASGDLVDVYGRDLPSGATDKRYDLFFLADSSSFGAAVAHFPGRVLYGPYVELNTGFSTPELYLTIAEAEVRSGSVAKGIEWLNQLRDSRIENNEHFSGVSKEKALELVLDERRRELPFTASNRLIDLKRLQVSGDLQKDIVHKLEGEEFKIDNSDPRLILPVPPTVLSLNPNIPQYDR
ncbi:MAG TPA: RagB/SusD family nutrient uptake outer membrane protein, partial [Candidatus Sphingobacterium stercoripullorum]|nr:RagB/SusD family nutrient uptake outer membrane protein [Candidatus Sphingobacterium stercoripullorum]